MSTKGIRYTKQMAYLAEMLSRLPYAMARVHMHTYHSTFLKQIIQTTFIERRKENHRPGIVEQPTKHQIHDHTPWGSVPQILTNMPQS